jgi:hypothetical protein
MPKNKAASKILDSIEEPKPERRTKLEIPSREGSRNNLEHAHSTERRRTKKMTKLGTAMRDRRIKKDDSEFEMLGHSNSDMYNIQSFYHQYLHTQPENEGDAEIVKNMNSKFLKILRMKLSEGPPLKETPVLFEE